MMLILIHLKEYHRRSTADSTNFKSSSNKSDDNINKGNISEKFFNFTFYKVDPKWRWLNEIGKDESSTEFLELLNASEYKNEN